jgi:hypothetical protein
MTNRNPSQNCNRRPAMNHKRPELQGPAVNLYIVPKHPRALRLPADGEGHELLKTIVVVVAWLVIMSALGLVILQAAGAR